ncbi:hypothetical protein B0H13DRAFT_1867935 [Mycena leptocephala]|nr:hypothetical protein B0H13DRAFT_1867935 [Mycena leptocephala]
MYMLAAPLTLHAAIEFAVLELNLLSNILEGCATAIGLGLVLFNQATQLSSMFAYFHDYYQNVTFPGPWVACDNHISTGHSLFRQTSSVQADADHENETVDGAFAAALRGMGLNEESEDELEEDFSFASSVEEEDWFPHGSRTMFMLDLLDNFPRLRLSDDHLKAILWVMRECRTPNFPTSSQLQKKNGAENIHRCPSSNLHILTAEKSSGP